MHEDGGLLETSLKLANLPPFELPKPPHNPAVPVVQPVKHMYLSCGKEVKLHRLVTVQGTTLFVTHFSVQSETAPSRRGLWSIDSSRTMSSPLMCNPTVVFHQSTVVTVACRLSITLSVICIAATLVSAQSTVSSSSTWNEPRLPNRGRTLGYPSFFTTPMVPNCRP